MIPSIEIGNYNPSADYPQVRQILDEADMYYEPSESEERLTEKSRRDPDSLMIASVGNEVVGTVSILEDGRMAFIFRLAVRKDMRGNGVGSELLKEAEKRLTERGLEEVWLLVNGNDTTLKDYYLKRGYSGGKNLYRFMTKGLE